MYVRGFHHWTEPGRYFFCTGGGLGWGMPAACGVSLGHGGAPVLCVVGDGSAMYSPQALWTAAAEQLPVVFAVVNNRQYKILKGYLRGMGGAAARTGRFIGMDLDDPPVDFLALARSMAVDATAVDHAGDVGRRREGGARRPAAPTCSSCRSPRDHDADLAGQAGEEPRPGPLDLVGEEPIERRHPEPAAVVQPHGERAARRPSSSTVGVEDPRRVLAPVVLDPLEPGVVVGLVDGAHHAEALGPGERARAGRAGRPTTPDRRRRRADATATARGTMSSHVGYRSRSSTQVNNVAGGHGASSEAITSTLASPARVPSLGGGARRPP